LFFLIGFEKKAADLVITATDAMQQTFDAAERIGDLKGVEQIGLNLAGAMKLAGFDLGFELGSLADGTCLPSSRVTLKNTIFYVCGVRGDGKTCPAHHEKKRSTRPNRHHRSFAA
jgi:hypothetical protein